MQYEILLTKNPNNGFTARPLALPELIVAADDEGEALARVRNAIADLQVHSRIVHIDLPLTLDDPWAAFLF